MLSGLLEAEGQVKGVRRLGDAPLLKTVPGVQMPKQPDACAEKHRHQMKLHLVDQSGPQKLLSRVRAARDAYISGSSRQSRLIQRTL